MDFSLSALSRTEKLFGMDPTGRNKNAKIINWLTLKAKHFIQKRKLFFKGELPLIGFLAEVRASLVTEKMVCRIENKPRKFKSWSKLYSALG